ncbi:MAG TPA: carbamoyltransferase C-terminal domain-containing protein [Xanthobacteraceae bacterium]|jgi:carbamoyltransferase
MKILAFQPGVHEASAAVFDGYRLIAAVSEERLNRVKGWGDAIPWLAIDEVLRITGWSRDAVDAIAMTRGYLPTHYYRFPLLRDIGYTIARWRERERTYRDIGTVSRRLGTADTLSLFRTDRFLRENAFRADVKLHIANHHESHALAALFYTDWDDALVYTSDGIGDNVSYSMRALRDGKLECFWGDDRQFLSFVPESGLANAYGAATIACGFRNLRHEGKLTGLAAYGKPEIAEPLARLFRLGEDGHVTTTFRSWPQLRDTVIDQCKGHSRETIAASIQAVIEDFTIRSLKFWLARSKSRRVAMAGGLFANVRLNRLIAESLPLDEVFVFPAMGDEGLPVGAALSFLLKQDGIATWLGQRRRLENVYLGRDFGAGIDETMSAAPGAMRLPGDPIRVATDLVKAGQAGAVYTGRMEFGPRALGARSIIASPTDAAINDRLNVRLSRSEFMPFAPYVLEEDAERVFEITDVNRYAARFMTVTCGVRPEWRERIPAVVHVDGTARPQIVREADNPLFGGILRRFRDETGLPVLINTSFNVHEEPIVNRPEECARAFVEGRVDFVATEKAVYVKS